MIAPLAGPFPGDRDTRRRKKCQSSYGELLPIRVPEAIRPLAIHERSGHRREIPKRHVYHRADVAASRDPVDELGPARRVEQRERGEILQAEWRPELSDDERRAYRRRGPPRVRWRQLRVGIGQCESGNGVAGGSAERGEIALDAEDDEVGGSTLYREARTVERER